MHSEAEITTALSNTNIGAGARASFLTLPGELRNRIYRLALVYESPLYVSASMNRGDPKFNGRVYLRRLPDHRTSLDASPKLLRVSKQVREEARTIFFEDNTFHFESDSLWRPVIECFERMAGQSSKSIATVKVTQMANFEQKSKHHRLALLNFTVKQSSSGVLQILDIHGQELDKKWPKLDMTGVGCCCNVVDTAHRYCNATASGEDGLAERDQIKGGESGERQVFAFLKDYVKELQKRRGYYGWTCKKLCSKCGGRL